MDCQFIECYEDEREVLRKIEELKAKEYAESDMFVLARSNEQLTLIRTRTDVEYHAAEGKGMGRFGVFLRGSPLPPYYAELAEETKAAAALYQQLLDGELLLFYNKDAIGKTANHPANGRNGYVSNGTGLLNSDEDKVFIDSIHYDNSKADGEND